jgi:tRNA A37 threonylcarbamoyladenosine synthetase subunit TsaC/SUA5/YrdC
LLWAVSICAVPETPSVSALFETSVNVVLPSAPSSGNSSVTSENEGTSRSPPAG